MYVDGAVVFRGWTHGIQYEMCNCWGNAYPNKCSIHVCLLPTPSTASSFS